MIRLTYYSVRSSMPQCPDLLLLEHRWLAGKATRSQPVCHICSYTYCTTAFRSDQTHIRSNRQTRSLLLWWTSKKIYSGRLRCRRRVLRAADQQPL